MATLLHTKTVTDTAAVLEAVEHVFFKKVSDELEAEHRKGVVCFIHPVICAMASEQFQTLSGSVLTPGIAAVGGGVPADVTLYKAMALGAFDPETNENYISLSARKNTKTVQWMIILSLQSSKFTDSVQEHQLSLLLTW